MTRPRNMLRRKGVWYFNKMVRGKRRRISTRTTDLKAAIKIAERLSTKVEDERWRPHVPTVAESWEVYQQTYTVRSAPLVEIARSWRTPCRCSASDDCQR
jgi:hypothetical protein